MTIDSEKIRHMTSNSAQISQVTSDLAVTNDLTNTI